MLAADRVTQEGTWCTTEVPYSVYSYCPVTRRTLSLDPEVRAPVSERRADPDFPPRDAAHPAPPPHNLCGEVICRRQPASVPGPVLLSSVKSLATHGVGGTQIHTQYVGCRECNIYEISQ